MRSAARRLLPGLVLLLVPCLAPAQAPGTWLEAQTAELALLDKVTARTKMQAVPVGQATEFGTLRIAVARCLRRPPEEPAEAAAWITVTEAAAPTPPQAAGQPSQSPAFRGWMFATSPALNPLEHPVYDIRVVACR